MSFAPLILFTYNRLDTLKETVSALQKNELCTSTDLFIFSDGAKNEHQTSNVAKVRIFIKNIKGFKSVTIYESQTNKGLAQSIIDGVSLILSQSEKVIVLEDDLITSENFLFYMNKALDYYAENEKIFSISGFTYPMKYINADDVYFTLRSSSWGWGTWNNRWKDIDWKVTDYPGFKKDRAQRQEFNKMGSDMARMLDKQMSGKGNSWAIRWCYHQFKISTYSVFPALSKVKNIGSDLTATNTIDNVGRFDTILDTTGNRNFRFTNKIELPRRLIRQFTSHFSIYTRAKYKLLNAFRKS